MIEYVSLQQQTVMVSHHICALNDSEACMLIDMFIKSSGNNNLDIIFDYRSEGFQQQIINHINAVVKKLVTEYRYDIDRFVYLTGSFPIDSNLEEYKSYPFDFLPKRIIFSNAMYFSYLSPDNQIDRRVQINVKPKKFLSMNGCPRTPRRLIVSWLLKNGLLKESFYSFDSSKVERYENNLLLDKYDVITSDCSMELKEPLILSKMFDSDQFDRIKEEDVYYFDNSYFSLIQETFYDDTLDSSTNDISFYPCTFITEKTYRPIYFKHPFIMVGPKGTLAGLREYGFKTFSPYFDESYDEIDDPVLRLGAILNETMRLCGLTDDQWLTIQQALLPIVEYNYNILKSMEPEGITK
jgi:hypothetical protein